ncbi:uncharacterized protein LOC126078866 [Elephas maximus indicus]|uniref:uncharacterized protein LOC126078866 n=1 Tax=Elephas maximus indicus TaxID=99487 RepID=UPI00211686F8|nr:uncharacterized protein LOC126078866 [Elephas maximus indicus]
MSQTQKDKERLGRSQSPDGNDSWKSVGPSNSEADLVHPTVISHRFVSFESLPSPPGQAWLLGRLRPLCALGLEASPGESSRQEGFREPWPPSCEGLARLTPAKPRELPPVFFFGGLPHPFSVPFPYSLFSSSLLRPQLLLSPSASLSPTPPSRAGISRLRASPQRTKATGRVRAARAPGNAVPRLPTIAHSAGSPPSGRGLGLVGTSQACRARGSSPARAGGVRGKGTPVRRETGKSRPQVPLARGKAVESTRIETPLARVTLPREKQSSYPTLWSAEAGSVAGCCSCGGSAPGKTPV